MGRAFSLGRDLQHRKIAVGIGPHQFGVKHPVIRQANLDRIGALDHVVVGEHVALGGVHDHTRADGLCFALLRLIRDIEEAAEERVLHQRILLARLGGDGHIDDGRHDILQHRRQGGGSGRDVRAGGKACTKQEDDQGQGAHHHGSGSSQ